MIDRPVVRLGTLVLALALPCVVSQSAERERIGLLVGFSDVATIGADLRLSSRVAVRPHMSYSWARSENAPVLADLSTDYATFDTTERYLGVGCDVLLSLNTAQPLQPYVGLGLNTSRADVPYADNDAGTIVYRNGALHRTSAFALFGARYSLSHHLALYGEAAFGYLSSERFGFGGRRLHTREWATLSPGLGVVFYFK